MCIDVQTLATQAHVHRNTISRAPASESVQKFLREALRVIRAAHDLSGDVVRAIFWYRNEPLPPFGYKTAEQLVSEGRSGCRRMKLITLTDVTVYRMHVPRWAVAPTSGAGAAKYVGRVNRPGMEALYLAMQTDTAFLHRVR